MALVLLHVVITGIAVAHILLRRHRLPEARAAWLLIVSVLPYLGALGYVFLGQTSIGRGRIQSMKRSASLLPMPVAAMGTQHAKANPSLSDEAAAILRVGQSISGYEAVGGNSALLLENSDAAIDAMVADIDLAKDHVHLIFYIWLDDHNGTKMAEAMMRAARRGVACRAMIDDIGSRKFAHGMLWKRLAEAGVQTRTALSVGNPLYRIFNGRIDLRNHRKILVIDNGITYCGSLNCADPAFLPKARYGPWVDAVMRFTGPVVRQNQHLFATDWMGNGGDDVSDILRQPQEPAGDGFVAQVVATGPTFRADAMPEMFTSLIFAARSSLFITTPYYVPTQALQAAICAAANRGVDVTLIFPERNDDFAVGAASRSHYESLLEAGVKIYEFHPGLLHTKSLTVDGQITFIGSANMDRRSFDLNYENNILLIDAPLTSAMRARQEQYRMQSRRITPEEVNSWTIRQRITNNALAILGPVL